MEQRLILLTFLTLCSASLPDRDQQFRLVALGCSIDLRCPLRDPYASPEMYLMQELKSGKLQARIEDGEKVSKSGQIFTINNIRRSDEGGYYCKVQETKIVMDYLFPYEKTQGNCKSIHSSILPESVSINEGDSVTLTCNITGDSIDSVAWLKDKMPLFGINTRALKLTAVPTSRAGVYECRAISLKHYLYDGYKAKPGILLVTGFHFVAKMKPITFLTVGDSVTISCETNVQSASSSLWRKIENNPAQQMVPNGGSIIRRNNTYHFSSVTLDDAGVYVCEATSSVIKKTIEKEIITLLVFPDKDTDPQAQVVPLSKDVILGQDFNFTCVTYGKGIWVTWLKNGKAVRNNQTDTQAAKGTSSTFHRNVLIIKKATIADEGTYTCKVTTSLQPGYSNNVTAKLRVKECLEPNGTFPDPTDAYGYFECIQGIAVKKDCPNRQYWNQVEKICNAISPSNPTQTDPVDVPTSWKITSFIVVSVAFFLLLLIIAAILYRRRQLYGGFYIFTTPPLPDMITRLDASIPLIEQVNKLPYHKRWEFPRGQLHFDKILGSGAFGEVYLAEADGCIVTDSTTKGVRHRLLSRRNLRRGTTVAMKGPVKVAVKTLKGDAGESEHKDLLSELKILIHIGSHENIVNLLGACTRGRHRDLCVIIEYCPHGSMLQFLRDKRNMYHPTWLPPTEDAAEQFSLTDVVSSAFQVARAMEFLVSRKCVHRDVAARNVLVGENYVVKVADFGLARDVYKDNKYIKVTRGLLPVKWMAIESLIDRVYSAQSDVWSFGVFLWELFTLGGCPYHLLPISEIFQFLKEGNRMECPVNCPDEMYAMMRDCWMENPEDRPTFTSLVQRLDHVIKSNMAATGDVEHLEVESEHDPLIDNDGYLKPVETLLPKEALYVGSDMTCTNEGFKKETTVLECLDVESEHDPLIDNDGYLKTLLPKQALYVGSDMTCTKEGFEETTV